eukprot:Skav201200  [mRNA]  locus=scaffold633:504265:507339:- [translate_table: standard]
MVSDLIGSTGCDERTRRLQTSEMIAWELEYRSTFIDVKEDSRETRERSQSCPPPRRLRVKLDAYEVEEQMKGFSKGSWPEISGVITACAGAFANQTVAQVKPERAGSPWSPAAGHCLQELEEVVEVPAPALEVANEEEGDISEAEQGAMMCHDVPRVLQDS